MIYVGDKFGGGGGAQGGVYITDITPQNPANNVGGKIYSSDGVVLESCVSDTQLIRVHIFALAGITNFKPTVIINDIPAILTRRNGGHDFTGYADIDLAGKLIVTANHEDGATDEVSIQIETGPQITAVFVGGYPGTQTELKEDDTFQIRVTSDVPMTRIVLIDSGAAKGDTFDFPATTVQTITMRAANRGTTPLVLAASMRAMTPNGSFGNTYTTSDGGAVNGINTVILNNARPVITIGSITYPTGQRALKDSEQAQIPVSITNYDIVNFDSPNNELQIMSGVIGTVTVQRVSGEYNVSVPNFRVTAIKTSNGAINSTTRVVNIANIPPIINIIVPAARLRSGGSNGTNVQNHVITIQSNQELYEAPSVNAPAGTWEAAPFAGGTLNWTRILHVSDSDPKGTFIFTGLQARNLAGRIVNTINNGSSYVLGGFVFRILTIPAWPVRKVQIGTLVTDVSKLRCTNLSKGVSGSLNFIYRNDTASVIDRYTITDAADNPNPNADYWYNCDTPNASSNTTGTMQIELEEVV